MKKLIVIAIVSMMASLQAFAVPGIDCNTPDARCSAFELDVDAEVLASIDFTQVTALDLGQVTKGEAVSVEADGSDSGSRGKQAGNLDITFTASSEDLVISCIAASSNVDFGNAEGATAFSSCELQENNLGILGAVITLSPTQQSNEGAQSSIGLGGQITVPSNATDGAKTGIMRVEVAYQ